MSKLDAHLATLKGVLHRLDAVGASGFEGLLAALLSSVASTPFRLSKSGSQRGRDGQSALDHGAVLFEAKLYAGDIPKPALMSKLADLALDDRGGCDLWILGATNEVAAQDASDLRNLGERLGIGTLILDWPDNALPPLAVLLALEPEATLDFLSANVEGGINAAAIRSALAALNHDTLFAGIATKIAEAIRAPSTAVVLARKANTDWLNAQFSNTAAARAAFGQALAPGDPAVRNVLDRPTLRQRISDHLLQSASDKILFLLGSDGNGKSWLFAQTWLGWADKPLTIVLIPEDIRGLAPEEVRDLVLAKLIAQTGQTTDAATTVRWRRIFKQWAASPRPAHPNVVIFVDGINQRSQLDWRRFLESLERCALEMHGRLVISCREMFFQDRIQGQLIATTDQIAVPEWNDQELNTLLTPLGTSVAHLTPPVTRSLRNPRIFSVALDLLNRQQIEGLAELSVSRLLFEYIRKHARDVTNAPSVGEFVQHLRQHADNIIRRLSAAETDDLTRFERDAASDSLRERLLAAAEGRFFEIDAGDTAHYALKEDGLPLALGLALVGALQRAHRNHADVEVALTAILDPIAALDRTADIVLAAILAAALDRHCPEPVTAALVAAFVRLQNLDGKLFEEFSALARHAPHAYLTAMEVNAQTGRTINNLNWLEAALANASIDQTAWAVISAAIRRWLSYYSLAPVRRMMQHRVGTDAKAIMQEREEKQAELDARIAGLSPAESALLAGLTREERSDHVRLSRLAFLLLADKPLVSFADDLRNWSFSVSLNSDIHASFEEFGHLVELNRRDWAETRTALLQSAALFHDATISSIGQWALVTILRVTGHSDDAEDAERRVEILRADRPKFAGWRLVEKYCANDPCDPDSPRPDNITQTAARYRALDVDQLWRGRGRGQDDHFYEMARAGVARFEPDAAVAITRTFADRVLQRDGMELRFALSLLKTQSALLTAGNVQRLLAKGADCAARARAGAERDSELWICGEYALLIALPHLSGEAQLDALLAYPPEENILLDITHVLRAVPADIFAARFLSAIQTGDHIAQFRALTFAQHTDTPLSEGVRAALKPLLQSPHAMVRMAALGLVAECEDPELVRTVAESDWSADKPDASKAHFEIWYGSRVLITAAEQGIIGIESALSRITTGLLGWAARRLGAEGSRAVAGRLGLAIAKAIDYQVDVALPDVERNLSDDRNEPTLLRYADKHENLQGRTLAERLPETESAMRERYRRYAATLREFERALDKAGARLIIDDGRLDGAFDAFVAAEPGFAEDWGKVFVDLPDRKLNQVHNVALMTTKALCATNPTLAIALFRRLGKSEPHIRLLVGTAALSYDAVCMWSAPSSPELDAFLFERLDRTTNDHAISAEVLAALRGGKGELLKSYVHDRLARPEPSWTARALMVCGFSTDRDWTWSILDRFGDKHGIVGRAHAAASYALARHGYAEHWFTILRTTEDAITFWQAGILFGEIGDGRFTLDRDIGPTGHPWKAFGESLNDLSEERIKHWKKKREEKLFGGKPPETIFVLGS
ncbi:MAG TPA: hypothetical protein VGF97_09870 [Rhizomicrobium sp.]|jgi:hypothetical protein